MYGPGLLGDLAVIFGVSVLVVLLLHRLRLPTIAGFLVSGLLIGPHGLGLVSSSERLEVLADTGVMLLLFTVGLEFSLTALRRIWRTALAGSLLPIVALAVMGGSASTLAGLPAGGGVYLGFLVGLSSTVIALRALADRGQIDSPHGRVATGVAVFQDLLLVPMMLLTPFLATGPNAGEGWLPALMDPALALLQAAAVIAGVLVVALWIVPRLLQALTSLRSREVFVISIFLICLGTAWITSAVGLSLALGSFLAGMVLSESEYGHQALADVVPFRDSLNCLFFVTVGMLMDPQVIVRAPIPVLAAAGGIIIVKLVLIGGVLLLIGQRPTVALQAGLALCQVGEFAFVLMRFGSGRGLMSDQTSHLFLAAAVLTMIVTPLVLAACPPLLALVQRWEEGPWWRSRADLRISPEGLGDLSGHVIIVGYGFNGRNLARVLKEIEIPYIVLDMNPETIRQARQAGDPILFGDAASSGILEAPRAAHARVLVLAISDPVSTRRAVAMARQRYPALYIVVRTRYLAEMDELYKLGASAVIPEEIETSMEIFARVLECFGVPREALIKHARRIRAERYGLFRDGRPVSGGGPDAGRQIDLGELKRYMTDAEVRIITIAAGSAAAGRSLRDLDLRATTGATVLAVVRDGKVTGVPPPDMKLCEGDAIILLGSVEQISGGVEALTDQPGGGEGGGSPADGSVSLSSSGGTSTPKNR